MLKGETFIVKGIPIKVSVRQISTLQMKNSLCKGCKLFAVHVMNDEHMNKEDKLKFDDIPILKEISDVFPEEILGLALKRELDFAIELVPEVVPNSKAPYWMNI